ncbi:uncharacterized protein ARMOST_21842 [Armillaria ostoyae]|uniref:Uncharacterized protein n=1 Tax=Armillaria ostoyae TaxID=47428 RepID=A0A284SB64_ARMOS|nr:uncharacterized protein ARMOST_21842 [Armillaria ostoyae]
MPRYLDLESCLQAARLTAAAGEMAPFPFVKGVAQCVVVVLEIIQKAANNRNDLRDLAESIVNTLVAVRDAVIEHGPTSTSHFQNICVEFQDYMTELLSKLNNERRLRGIRRVLKAKKISDDISAYRQRVQAAKEDFLIRTTTTTQFVLSDIQDQVTTRFSALAGAVAASERNVTSVIKDNIEEIRTSGVLQSETMEKLQMTLRDFQQRDFYKGVVRDLIPGDIYLKAPIKYASVYSGSDDYDEYHAIIDDRPKIVRVFRVKADQKERVMQQFQKEVDRRLYLRCHEQFYHHTYSDFEIDIRILPSFLVYAPHQVFQLLYSMEVPMNDESIILKILCHVDQARGTQGIPFISVFKW